jgi:hypothetical protein
MTQYAGYSQDKRLKVHIYMPRGRGGQERARARREPGTRHTGAPPTAQAPGASVGWENGMRGMREPVAAQACWCRGPLTGCTLFKYPHQSTFS